MSTVAGLDVGQTRVRLDAANGEEPRQAWIRLDAADGEQPRDRCLACARAQQTIVNSRDP